MTQVKKIYWADKLGAISAFLCILHCLSVPTLLTLGISFLNNPIVAFLFILIAFISIFKVTQRRLKQPISIFMWIAFLGFVISIIFEERAAFFEYTMFLFSISIILGHIYNMRYCLK